MEIYYLYNDERDEIEAIAKGYRNDVYVKTTTGMYHVHIYDIVRLQQDFEDEQQEQGYYSIDHNLILVEEVSKKVVVNTVKKLEEEGYFEKIKPLEEATIQELPFKHIIN
ncbi:hypothetical protein [Nodularia sp. UHCC 0506]|uniref:hypothetical protein n=1 Tax=Nodularia sp. UHCC 0506 TaxID=3110243 RepID=UPI002B218732|nr:hypothetical protein [Nodularia sp. UHCC 0506]MEA5516991.1 hypothetical protein [Nodularia sp. UHCC 0506]